MRKTKVKAPEKKEPTQRKIQVKLRERYHRIARKAAQRDGRRGLEIWIENAILEEAERQHTARKARK